MRNLFMMLFLMLFAAPALALDVSELKNVPILHEGRIKPMDTVARIYLQRLSGSDDGAIEWLAQVLFSPGDALSQTVFHIPSQTLRLMLELPDAPEHRYSYETLTPKLRLQEEALKQLAVKDPNQMTATERSLWVLYENIDAMTQLTGALSLMLPMEIPPSPRLREELHLPEKPYDTYLSLLSFQPVIQEQMQQLVKQKGSDLATYSDDETKLSLLAMRLAAIASTGNGNHLFRVMPSSWSEEGEWLSPWAVIQRGEGSARTTALQADWQELVIAYQTQNQPRWDDALWKMKEHLQPVAGVSSNLLQWEIFYHQLHLIELAMLLYLVALVASCLPPRWQIVLNIAMPAALLLHLSAIIMRIIILGRPPVSTLYESVLFVALVTAGSGYLLYRRKRLIEGAWIGCLLGGFLLAISGIYAGDSDTMGMLIAVLNTNFWLATHVICITIGYACALLAGTLGHIALFQPHSRSWNYLQGSALVALLFTTVGTILGGIWADQSWGRFWGWDPKENGALLIVLWLVWVLHGRMTRHIGPAGFAALLSMTNVIVAISWFGVNLLGVGLHSYGFTSAAAIGLVVFCVAEAVLVAVLYARLRMRHA